MKGRNRRLRRPLNHEGALSSETSPILLSGATSTAQGTLGLAAQARSDAEPSAQHPSQAGTATSHAGSLDVNFQKMEKLMPSRAINHPMNVALRKSWTHEEFYRWAQSQEIGYEFDGFRPVAMTGGFNNSSAIGVNLITTLRNRLRGTGCRPLGPDAGVETVKKAPRNAIRYPDALVTCTKFDGDAKSVPGVVVIFEVVGKTPDSIHRDHYEKVLEYASVPSILKYVILESTHVGLTILGRSNPDETWKESFLSAADDILSLPEIGIDIPVAEIYAEIEFPGRSGISV